MTSKGLGASHRKELRHILSFPSWLRRRSGWGYMIAFLLTIPALSPLLSEGLPATHDGLHHLFRIYELDYCLRAGELYPRWFPNLGFGYGFPVLNYYAPLAYYLAMPFVILGSGYLLAMKLVYALGFAAAAVGMFGLSRPYLGGAGALLAAAAYTYLPYHIADAHVRGALPEFLALSILPFILWGLHVLIVEQRNVGLVLYGLSLSALILTHNLSVILALPLVGGMALAFAAASRHWKTLPKMILPSILAILGTAFYWLPAIAEVGYIRASQVAGGSEMVLSQLSALPQLISPKVIYEYTPFHDPTVSEHPLGLVAVLMALASLPVGALRWRRLPAPRRAWFLISWIMVLGGLLMMLPATGIIWENIPGLIYLQFPWRWHLLTTFGTAGLIGSLLVTGRDQDNHVHPHRAWQWALVPLLTTILAVSSLAGLSSERQRIPGQEGTIIESDVNLEGMAGYEFQIFLASRLWAGEEGGWLFEYLPTTVQEDPRELILPLEPGLIRPHEHDAPPPLQYVEVRHQKPLGAELFVGTREPATLRLHTFYFPGWQYRINDGWKEAYPGGRLGLLSIDVPAGDHQVEIRFGMTPWRWMGLFLTLLGLTGCLLWLYLRKQARYLLYGVFVCVLCAGLWVLHSKEGGTVHPNQRWANFDNQFALTAYHILPPSKQSDLLKVELWWLSLRQPNDDYKVFLHLEDQDGAKVAQRDIQPGMNHSPTSRWMANQLMHDRHPLAIPSDVPAGEYNLYLGLYHVETILNLNYLDEMGHPQDTRLLLEIIRLGTR